MRSRERQTRRSAPYDPWVAAEDRDDLTVAWTPLAAHMGGGFSVRRRGHSLIALDPSLADGARRAALTHELVHDERGGIVDPPGAPQAWRAVVAREEATVERESARRLAPAEVVGPAMAALAASDGGVTARALGHELELPEHLAAVAIAEAMGERARR